MIISKLSHLETPKAKAPLQKRKPNRAKAAVAQSEELPKTETELEEQARLESLMKPITYNGKKIMVYDDILPFIEFDMVKDMKGLA